MAIRRVPIRRIGNRPSLFMGGDREIVMMTGVVAAVHIFAAQEFYTLIVGVLLWVAALFVLRGVAKSDPRMRSVLWRLLTRYRKYYPARATPFRVNTRSQERRYR